MSRPKKLELRKSINLAACLELLGKTVKVPSLQLLPADFPEPVYFDRYPRWFEDEVAAYVERKANERPSVKRSKARAAQAADTPA